MASTILRTIMALVTMAMLSFVTVAYAEDLSPAATADSQWSFLGGYGVTHPGFGATDVTVKTVKLIPRYGKYLTGEFGEGWYRGRHLIFIEMPLEMVIQPDTAPLVGLNFLAAWQFTAHPVVNPYLFAGGGAIYTNADIPGVSSRFDGDYQSGVGIQIQHRPWAFSFEYRLHHISNAGTSSPNVPLNSSQFMAGITMYY